MSGQLRFKTFHLIRLDRKRAAVCRRASHETWKVNLDGQLRRYAVHLIPLDWKRAWPAIRSAGISKTKKMEKVGQLRLTTVHLNLLDWKRAAFCLENDLFSYCEGILFAAKCSPYGVHRSLINRPLMRLLLGQKGFCNKEYKNSVVCLTKERRTYKIINCFGAHKAWRFEKIS